MLGKFVNLPNKIIINKLVTNGAAPYSLADLTASAAEAVEAAWLAEAAA